MLKNLYLKTLKLAEKKRANYFLAFISFIESSIFPIPPDVLIIPMILAKPHRAFKIATIATISSVIGGVFGYFIGLFLWNEIGEAILDLVEDPLPHGSRVLKGRGGCFTLPIDGYSILYHFDERDEALTVLGVVDNQIETLH